MIKKITTVFALAASAVAFSQVGIQTETPQATLDVVGSPTNTTKLDGIIAPRITGAQLRAKNYTTTQTGALVYVTAADTSPSGQTLDVTSVGYYYFNGTKWVIAGAGDMVNIYNSDGTLTDGREVYLNNNALTFQGLQGHTKVDTGGASLVIKSETANRAQLRFFTQDMDGDGITSNFDIDLFADNYLQMFASGEMNGISFGTHNAQNPSPIEFVTSPGNLASGQTRMKITGKGNIGVETAAPTEKFDNAGITRLRELPLNGATNAHHTTSGGGESTSKDQTFTATRTLVSDANGVLGYVAGLPESNLNIYNANGSLTGARTMNLNGFPLEIVGALQTTSLGSNGFTQYGTSGSKRASIVLVANDNDSNGVTSRLNLFQDPEAVGQLMVGQDSRGLNIGSTSTALSAPIRFTTSSGANALGTQKMIITGIGNVGIGPVSAPTEKLDNEGITRLRTLPLNGATNAIFTQNNGAASATQNQTFTATRTVVADANGVLGYVNTLPSDAGTSKVVVLANAPGTQNVKAQFIPNAAIGQFTNESLDVYNAWTNNVFTVPTDLGGIYIIVMQNSNTHTSIGAATPTWHTMAYYEKSTDGGANWNTMIKHTYADLAGTIVDNGNTLYWTGFLNVGDMIRVRFSCNATTDNIVNYGGLSITKLAQ